MSSKFRKRPSWAKRNMKYENFSQFVSGSRLRRVQSLLEDPEAMENSPAACEQNAGVDAILCVSGIDSRYNEGCSELINYLLFGFFDVRKAEFERSGLPDEAIDDLMLVIGKSHVEVYCNPVNWFYFLPYVSHWSNVSFHCLQEEEYDLDTDKGTEAAEEFKVRSLIAMTSGCKRIGIPYYGQASNPDDRKFDKMLVEKWPVIQAFALEDFGGGGFFTLKYETLDISPRVHQLHSFQDPVTIEIITTENLPMLERQWKTMCDCVSMEIVKNKGILTENRISEPVCSFYQHGKAGSHQQISGASKLPYVLFGKNTSKAGIDCVQGGHAPPSCQLQLSPASSVGHMVCQVMSPRSPVTCCRTYFVTRLFQATSEAGEKESGNKSQPASGPDVNSDSEKTELRYLVCLYQAMVNAVMAAIQVYTQTASLEQARFKAVERLLAEISAVMTSTLAVYLSDKSKVVFTIESVLKNGSVEGVGEGRRSLLMKVASLSLYDLPSSSHTSPSPGSLVFSECFLPSTLTVTSGVKTTVDTDILYLTSHIPRFCMWGAGEDSPGQHKEALSELETLMVDQLGPLLMTGEKVHMTAGTQLTLPPESVQLFVYQNGVAVYSEYYGAFSLSAADCSDVHLFDGDSMSTSVLLMVTYHPQARAKLPPHLVCPLNTTLFFVFSPHSKAHNRLYGQVLTKWKEDCDMPAVSRIEASDLPAQLDSLHHYLQQVETHSSLHSLLTASHSTSLEEASHSIPHLPQFVKHLSVSSAIDTAVSSADLPHLLQREPSFQLTSDTQQVVVTVLTGAPGSEKDSLCKSLAQLGVDCIRWVVVRQMEEAWLDVPQLHKMLTSAVMTHFQQENNRRQTRILLLAPGFVNTPDVIAAILRHPDAKVRNVLKIGAITVCIDPLNLFMEHRMVLPMLLNQCAQGWANNIIFTSQTKAPSELLDEIQNLIRTVNTDVALLLAESGEIKRSTDVDQVLSDSGFEQPSMVRARLLLHPTWKLQGKTPPLKRAVDFNDVILRFSQPLEKNKLLQKMKGLPATLSKFPFEGNIYHIYGMVCFSDSRVTVDVQYTTLSQSLVLRTVDLNSQPLIRGKHHSYLVFTGCRLEEDPLKDWLRGCAKQRPEKKKHLTSSSLTKADIDKVHKQYHLEPLPSGWFYNGTHFVSMMGDKSQHHPLMKDFINDFVKKKNAEIDQYNAAIDSGRFADLFT